MATLQSLGDSRPGASTATDRENENQKLSILDLIDDPEVSIAYAIDIVFTVEFLHSGGTGVERERIDPAG
ncbi:MAG: hypothetical protein Q7S20_07180 [Gemmatimonadaceae bacterium]|nr:hypothetical protein [Gemmatimonadaceae bacterium]